MNVINRKTIIYYCEKHPLAKRALLVWYNEMVKYKFSSSNDLKKVYGNASIVNNKRIVFNIKENDYRLVVSVNFRRNACYTIWFGTHKQYDQIDVENVSYNLKL
ncbi:addiction module toxin RelE [Pelobium manganitolerans]|uniref:Addiction module toxin RelE n=1 Tax=Pelobium manganitolerans TaxID=1842495 RepID=A0A419S307_9SPHI|nr:type II toxin-antitoxin system HigB family toxin [Pelobium manganitolerans]RKD13679.1 addiction module toxin RelE [Pelobium manganitolerans]